MFVYPFAQLPGPRRSGSIHHDLGEIGKHRRTCTVQSVPRKYPHGATILDAPAQRCRYLLLLQISHKCLEGYVKQSKHFNNEKNLKPQCPLMSGNMLHKLHKHFQPPLTSPPAPVRILLYGSSRFFSNRSCYFSGTTTERVMMFCACFTEGMSIMLPRKVNAP